MDNRNKTIQAIEENKIITILRGLNEEQLIRTCEAMEKGGNPAGGGDLQCRG